jgi:DNA-binding transcriptional MerR regulator
VASGLPPSLLAPQGLRATLMIMTETMTIGTLARQADVTPRTLRYYERIGLLVPSARTDAGYRLYTARDAARLAFIRRAQALGLTLTEIADVIAVREAGTAPCQHVRALAQAKVAALNERIAELQALREELTRLAERAEAFEAECVEGSSICLAVESAQPATP